VSRYLFGTFLFFFYVFLFFQIPCIRVEASEFTVDEIKSNPTFHQRAEGFTLSLTQEEMEYFLDNLDQASYLLNIYNIHSLRIWAIGNNVFCAKDKDDLQGKFYLLEKKERFRIYRGEGTVNVRIIGAVSAEVVASIQYRNLSNDIIINDLEFWVRANNSFIDFICRFFRPILIKVLEKNFTSLIDIAKKFATQIRSNPEDAFNKLQIYINNVNNK